MLLLSLLWGLAMAMDTGLTAILCSAVGRQLVIGDDAAVVAGCFGNSTCPMDTRFESLMLLAIDKDRPQSLLVLIEHAEGLSDLQQSELLERTLKQHRVACCLVLVTHGLRFMLSAGSTLQVRALWSGTYGWTAPEVRRLLAADPDGCFTPNLQHFVHVPSVPLALLMVEVLLEQQQCVVEDVLWCSATFALRNLCDASAAAVFRELLQRDFSHERQVLPTRLIRDFSRSNPEHPKALHVLLGDRRLGLPKSDEAERCSPYLAGVLSLLQACDDGDDEQLKAGLAGADVGYELLDVLLQRASTAGLRRRLAAHALSMMRRDRVFRAQTAFLRGLESGRLARVRGLFQALLQVPLVYAIDIFEEHRVPRDVLNAVLAALLDVSLA